jgi:acetyl esterase/lipase
MERHIPGPPGAPEVRLWVVDPAPAEKSKPVLLHMPGGGFMMRRRSGNLSRFLRRRAIPVRLTTITPPRSNGFTLMRRSSASIPGLDDRTGSTRPAPPAVGHFMWNASANSLAWSSLLGVPTGSSRVPAAAVPARAATVVGLPPAWIGVGALDLFVAEDMEYARRLVQGSRDRTPGRAWCLPRIRSGRAGRRSLSAIQRELEVCAAQGIRHWQSCLERPARPAASIACSQTLVVESWPAKGSVV